MYLKYNYVNHQKWNGFTSLVFDKCAVYISYFVAHCYNMKAKEFFKK